MNSVLKEKLEESRGIVARAIEEYNPYAIVVMVSGGDDSLTALNVARYLNIPYTHIIHGNTRTGIQETTDFVRGLTEGDPAIYLEADAGTAYEDYIARKGFFGKGLTAHDYAYRILKATTFRKIVSKEIRQRKRNRNVLFLNGARRQESPRRMVTMINPYRIDPGAPTNIWVNIINEWSKGDCLDFLGEMGISRNPVSELLHRSGECMCGTMQSKDEGEEAAFWFPKWGQWRDEMEKLARVNGFDWGWSEQMPRKQRPVCNEFSPMCTGCVLKNHETPEKDD